ncbi:hypothetical protein EB796_000285 [Bugula neritina]|uniref:Uncharacterized protein n=1 Tax=Bugula neritina TaxID=10212 RepID=A0A7J7J1N4_BUGNE|nr:hypothetical protein EB796_021673 [Bugula neritina]KAF6041413.1 hypothetical protein EB796_000285 [Bugula neritina]
MASKLYSNYNKLKHTVKEYQAPSTVSTPYKEDKQSEHRNSEDNISLLSSHSALGLPFSIDDSLSGFDDGGKSFSTDITYSGVSSAFITKYTTSPSAQVMLDAVDSLFKFPPPSSVSTPSMSEPVIEVVMCSSTVCDNCSTILYDEDIMAGWSAQDSELSTTCRFCDNKQLPFMMIDIKDLRAKDTFDKNSAFTDDGVLSSPPLTPRSSQTNRIEPIKLPYLSPIVLRKELESVLDREGDVCLTSSSFVDNHAIVYWNLMWYFKRMNFPSHLPQLLFHSSCLTFNNIELPSPQPSNMILRLVWNHPRLHEKMAAPMYKLWNESGSKSTVVRALLTDEKAATRSFMQQMLTHVECNDIYTPLKMIINNRKLYKRNSNNRCQSAYRDILFLAFVYFGREVMDHDAFDREYKLAFKRLELTDKLHLTKSDAPPSPTVMWCRKLYGNLEVC